MMGERHRIATEATSFANDMETTPDKQRDGDEQNGKSSKFGWNPAHPVGTCGDCGAEMAHNVPRLGADGGFVHKATGKLECAAALALEEIEFTETEPEPCPECKERKVVCACLRNTCIHCGKPVGNIESIVCEVCAARCKNER